MLKLTKHGGVGPKLFGEFRYPTAPLRADFPDRDLNRALRALRPPRVDITIDRVHLVNQYQCPDLGYYTWDVVEEIHFG
ncbi:hypothetical protein [Streptomyces sp. NPDC056061]|uniref:hypothetical protein n=1 Tax=Streptomyces sp. NPDC056061 TaxID=3345700 RepID=UPI0035DEFF74